ncbi:bifunctional 4-hydroxy-2-oxoglutarate aldolase/2-dehydro-3-deoxy-phosphogluconate aldolase [Candidatus Methylospira mobilis]|uniref:2-dehydro-3-deoxy-phosphogluconate aldolase n=1 Tax=Candidatus Methylospira mobilis TaxID=1808979 RepID=A0A5Q0BK36_9GAMM|nr:bifunctional 4-hydroxy-2-oxoglutarate aldolase/2-dehydro-3-deoxy-phosphogluconate aldolase [Candidatus Methylospira mobilis]QFY42544.1 bifunctional 4-hydroxy-2-oxoglutarate aldolase/2-dehydro-3-deoxy-phosphogluconate aldolase [Candidatus Methylospira mobilis]WNV04343.1 bifunctional 4-hydroxy-2-oxoglutarate aldolase/2-dehydro-3-deoxy-phosphogluconate aldolase [Candidatus Methylospira mobilis]
MNLKEIIDATSVMPVMVVERVEDAVPLARALVDGGIRVLEITLRTAAGLDAVRAIRQAVPDAIVGVGTIATPEQLQASINAGAQFGVSPGSTPTLLKAIAASGLPFFPGVATMSEVMQALESGFTVQKFFPAVAAGGTKMLDSFRGPFPQVQFCPTGGINAQNAADFFKLPNVVCIGGSWLTPKELVSAGSWAEITQLAREASALKP